jgi:hypothetical protein
MYKTPQGTPCNPGDFARWQLEQVRAENERIQQKLAERELERRKKEAEASEPNGTGNPFTEKHWNITRQMLMIEKDFSRAARLEQLAIETKTHRHPPKPGEALADR